MKCVALVLVMVASGVAHADVTVDVQLSPEGEQLANQLGVSAADLAARIQTRVDDAYDARNVDGFLKSFTDASAFSARGLGVDYVSMPKNLILGVGANFAIAGSGDFDAPERPTEGPAANIAFMAGMNLADYGNPRWSLFGNGFYRKASFSKLDGSITSAGFHAQYRALLPQAPNGAATDVLRWTGLDITSGLELTRWSLGTKDDIQTGFMGAPLVLDSTGTFDVKANAMTIPVEVSTGIRIALLVSVYVGAAVDFSASTGKLSANLDGNLLTSDNRNVGTTTIVGNGNTNGSPVAERVFTGAQLNVWKLRAYVQINASATPAASIGAGIRGVL